MSPIGPGSSKPRGSGLVEQPSENDTGSKEKREDEEEEGEEKEGVDVEAP